MQIAEVDHASDDRSSSEYEMESSPGGSSPVPLALPRMTTVPAAMSDFAEGHSSPDTADIASHTLQGQESDVPAIHVSNGLQNAHVVRQAAHVVADGEDTAVAGRVETHPVPIDHQSSSPLPQQLEAIVRRVFPAHLGAEVPDGTSEIPKTDSVRRDGMPAERSSPVLMNWEEYFLRDQGDTGTRIRGVSPYGQQLNLDGAERFSEFWRDQNSLPPDETEAKLPQVTVGDRPAFTAQPAETIMAGTHGRIASNPPPSPLPPPVAAHGQPAVSAQDTTDSAVRAATRSIVFDVAQPDLGRVNIRVAMTNDVVHTHLSADRPEVGQFLVNGQDRLQAAFQANGLDMGQFRVDIDRQGSGRSFQQGASQDQGQAWHQDSPGMKWGQSQERQDEPRPSLQGLLNVVA